MQDERRRALESGDAEKARALSQRELELIRTKEGLSNALARP
jgi:hypothetical protein